MNCPSCSGRLMSSNPLLETLSPKQWKVARCSALGQTREEIAVTCDITETNVSSMLWTIRNKLGVRNDVELTLLLLGLLIQAQQVVEEMAR